MVSRRPRTIGWSATAVAVVCCACSTETRAQATAEPPAGTQRAASSLEQRQQVIRDRVQQLESRMLKLSHLLAESEPAKAERLRDALELVGSRRIDAGVRDAAQLLATGRLSEAEQQQEVLLADLDALLTLLTSSLSDVERRRAERERLEALKRDIRALLDDQLQLLYRTQRLEPPAAAGERDTGRTDEVAELFGQLEQLQRLAQRRAADLHRQMQPPGAQDPPPPGTQQVGAAAREMQQAADRLGQRQPAEAGQSEQDALQQLQAALDELDDALRQVRREESEETLTALGVRLRNMLTREQQVRASVATLDSKGSPNWTRVDQLTLAESAELQQGVTDGCQATLRIVLDEGSTVIVPELMRQMASDMAEVAARLQRADTSPGTLGVLDDIIALLQEFLDAIEQKRQADARREQEGQAPPQGPQPLLPGSAELKLLRSAQLRLNGRTRDIQVSAPQTDDERSRTLERLSRRQRYLADLARRMNERE